MTDTGKAARRQHGNRFACKRAKVRRKARKAFGTLPYSEKRKNGQAFEREYKPAAPAGDDRNLYRPGRAA